MRLARLLHIGELPEVRVPTEAEEAARDLVRCREDARADLMRARHRLSKLLLRHGLVYCGGTAWTCVHEQWLRRQRFAAVGVQIAFAEYFDTVLATAARRDRLDLEIVAMAADPSWAPIVNRLSSIRGIGTLTGFALATEIGDWQRFTGNSIGAYLGLIPAEASSGARRVQGSITKAGNTHARRLLVEAAWHHQRPLLVPGKDLRRRRDKVAPAVRARAELADRRLHYRWNSLQARGKRSTLSAVAVARELAGWCWSLAVMDE
jgi:transposase